MLRIDVVTLFPEIYEPVLSTSIPGRAAAKGIVEYVLTDLRTFGVGNYQKIDDRPYGGGPGMVLAAPVLAAAVDVAIEQDPRRPRVLVPSPVGKPLTHEVVEELAAASRLMLVAGHYEGYDERFIDEYDATEISLGDFVLSGGELAAMCIIDAVVRLLPGVLGHADGASSDSFGPAADGLLEHPQYTKPRSWRGRDVPEVLLSGDHAKIAAWQREQREQRTATRRPDLLEPRGDGEESSA